MKLAAMGLSLCVVLPLITSAARGGDAQQGKRLALMRCAVCHIVEPNQRDEIADARPGRSCICSRRAPRQNEFQPEAARG